MRLAPILLVAACGGAPALQTVRIVNQSPRPIDELYVYPTGSPKHGSSHGPLAPGAATQVAVQPGGVEVLAISAKLQVDEHTRDRPTASQDIEIHGPAEVVFYDADHAPPEVKKPGVFGIEFVVPQPRPALTDPDAPQPAPPAP